MRKIISAITLVMVSVVVYGQPLKLNKANSQMSILGTSSIHDWASVVEKFDASATRRENEMVNVKFEASVKSIKSGKSGMDKNTYTALDADRYSKISFAASSLKIEGGKLTGNGSLTIKGKTNQIPVNLTFQQKELYIVSGEVELKMTDYGIEPPTALLGTIKTGDAITIAITFALEK